MSFNLHVLIDQKSLNISTNSLKINEIGLSTHIFHPLEHIYDVSITKDFVIVVTQEDKNFSSTINTYDWNGNHLWNIADIIGDAKMLWGVFLTTKELMKHHSEFDESKYDDKCELFCCSADNHLYIVDLGKRELIQVLETR